LQAISWQSHPVIIEDGDCMRSVDSQPQEVEPHVELRMQRRADAPQRPTVGGSNARNIGRVNDQHVCRARPAVPVFDAARTAQAG